VTAFSATAPALAASRAAGLSPLTVALVAVLVLAPAASVVAARWVPGTELVLWLAPAGVLLGVALSRVRAPALLLHLFACFLGEGAAVWAVASMLPGQTFQEQLTQLARRFGAWVGVVQAGGTATDNLLFILFLACLAWFVGYSSAYAALAMDSPWWAIAANGCALLVNASYIGRTDLYLPAFLLAALLLVARLQLVARERGWRASGLGYPRGLANGALPAGLALSVGLLAVAFLLPAAPTLKAALDRLRQAAQAQGPPAALEGVRDELERLFGGVPGRDSASGFTGNLELRGEFQPGAEVVAEVVAARGRYWRAVTFEGYTGRGWRATIEPQRRDVLANEQFPPVYQARANLEQRVTVRAPRGDTLLAAAQPRLISLGAAAEFSGGSEGGDSLANDLVSSLRASRVRNPGFSYTSSRLSRSPTRWRSARRGPSIRPSFGSGTGNRRRCRRASASWRRALARRPWHHTTALARSRRTCAS